MDAICHAFIPQTSGVEDHLFPSEQQLCQAEAAVMELQSYRRLCFYRFYCCRYNFPSVRNLIDSAGRDSELHPIYHVLMQGNFIIPVARADQSGTWKDFLHTKVIMQQQCVAATHWGFHVCQAFPRAISTEFSASNLGQ